MAEKQKPRKSHPGHQQEPNWRHKHHSNTSKNRYRREVVLEKFLPSQSFPISVPDDILIVYLAESELPACKTEKFAHSLGDSVSSRKFVPRERNTEKTAHENVRKHDEEVKIPAEPKKVEEKTDYSEIWDIHETKSEIPASLVNSRSEGTIKRNTDIPTSDAKPTGEINDGNKESSAQSKPKPTVSKVTRWENLDKERLNNEIPRKPEPAAEKPKPESKPEPSPALESKDQEKKAQAKPEPEAKEDSKQSAPLPEAKKVHFEKEELPAKDSKPEPPSKPEPSKSKPQQKPDPKPSKELKDLKESKEPKKPSEPAKEAKPAKEAQSSPFDSKPSKAQGKAQAKSPWGQDSKKPFEDSEKPKNQENLENPANVAKPAKPASSLAEDLKKSQILPSFNKELIESFVKLDNPFAKVLMLAGKTEGNSVSFEATGKVFEKLWFYRDRNGNVQGPFSCLEMFEWAVKGSFPSSLEIAFCNNEFAGMNGYQSKWKKSQVALAGRSLEGEGKREEVKSVKGPWGDSSKLFSNKK